MHMDDITRRRISGAADLRESLYDLVFSSRVVSVPASERRSIREGTGVSTEVVQEVVTKLIDDEEFREVFLADRKGVLAGYKLTGVEEDALTELDVAALLSVAKTFNPEGRGISIGSVYFKT